MALQPCLYFHAEEVRSFHRHACRLFVGEVGAQRQRLEARARAQLLAEVLEIGFRKLHQVAELLEQGVHVVHLFGHDFECVHRVILRQYHAVAVEDQAARRRDRNRSYAVRLGERFVVAVAENLEPRQTQHQHQTQHREDDGGDQQAVVENPGFAEVVLDRDIEHEALGTSNEMNMILNRQGARVARKSDSRDLLPGVPGVLAVDFILK